MLPQNLNADPSPRCSGSFLPCPASPGGREEVRDQVFGGTRGSLCLRAGVPAPGLQHADVPARRQLERAGAALRRYGAEFGFI